MSKNKIGIEIKYAEKLVKSLNDLLANYQIFYQNTRGFHWNIRGKSFFELHLKFEELYNDLQIKIDEIAERVLTLGNTPKHTFVDYLKIANIKQEKNISNGEKAVQSILSSLEVLISKQRNLLDLSDKADDEGTNALMSDYISQQEKISWMYSAYLG